MRSIDIKLYSAKKAEQIIENNSDWIRTLSLRYPIPEACVKAILYKELTEIDVLDVLADHAVREYWLRYTLRRRLGFKDATPAIRRGVFGKRDSSTGYAQIFAYVGINAANFALDRGLSDCTALNIPSDHQLRSDDPDDLRMIWTRLNTDTKFNLELAALNLLAAAEEMIGRIDFGGYSADELKLVLTRYNADVKHITAYGEAAYQHYLRYNTSL